MIYCAKLELAKIWIKVTSQAQNNIYFYESPKDIGVLEPYAIIRAHELTTTIRRFISWAGLIATRPEIAETFGNASTAPVKLATDLRGVVKNSIQDRIFPNVVLQRRKFIAMMTLIGVTRVLESEFHVMIAYKDQKWEEDFSG